LSECTSGAALLAAAGEVITERVELGALGVVYARALTAGEFYQGRQRWLSGQPEGAQLGQAEIVGLCLCDAAGDPLLDDPAADGGKLPLAVVGRVWPVVARLNGFEDDEKND